MKTARIVTFLAIAGLISLNSCSKKTDDVTPATTSSTVNFQTKIDGKAYTPDYAYALATNPGINGYYGIYGLDSKTSNVVVIALPNTVGEGTFPINATNIGMISFNQQDFSTVNGGSGTVTITKKTATYMTGTFSFTALDATGTKKLALTEGAFNVNIR